jgi:hypothetical protein
MDPARVQALSDIDAIAEQFRATDIEVFIRTKALGEGMCFEDAREDIRQVLQVVGELANATMDDIPTIRLQNMLGEIRGIGQILAKMQRFEVAASPNPQTEHDGLITSLRAQYEQLFSWISPVLVYSRTSQAGFANLTAVADDGRGKLKRLLEDAELARSGIEKQANDALGAARAAAQQSGVKAHAKIFEKQADEHAARSTKWLWVTALSASTALGLTAWNVWYHVFHPPAYTALQFTQVAIAKVLFFSLLFAMVVWSARIYRAHRHNEVVNRHRQNALSTFEAFVAGANDAETKGAVLLQATASIFAPQSTGYNENDADVAKPQVLEIIRSLGAASR